MFNYGRLAGKPYCLNIAIGILKIVLGRTFVKAQIFTWLPLGWSQLASTFTRLPTSNIAPQAFLETAVLEIVILEIVLFYKSYTAPLGLV